MSNIDGQKRGINSLVKALGNKMERLQKERQSKVLKMKSVMKAMKGLMQKDENAPQLKTQLGDFIQMGEETTKLHESIIPLLLMEEQKKQNTWVTNVLKCNNGSNEDVKQWLSKTMRQLSHTIAHDANKHHNTMSHVSKHSGQNVEASVKQDYIKISKDLATRAFWEPTKNSFCLHGQSSYMSTYRIKDVLNFFKL